MDQRISDDQPPGSCDGDRRQFERSVCDDETQKPFAVRCANAGPRDPAADRAGEWYPVLAVISDGEDWGKSRTTLDSVLKAKKKFPLVTVNTIGFNISRQDKWFADLCRIATHPRGCAPAGDRGQLQAILESFYRYRPPAS